MKFSAVIPTYNRPADLRLCLESILDQNILPAEICIIDDGDLPLDFISQQKNIFSAKQAVLSYHKKDHAAHDRGLSESKNLALNLTQDEIIFFLDDDLVLKQNFFEPIMKIWENNSDEKLIGVGGMILNGRKKNFMEKIYNRVFGLASKLAWDVNSVGYQIWDDYIVSPTKGYYSHGGVSSYKRLEVLKLNGFKTFRGGRSALEDVDFCLRAKNAGFYFVLEPEAKTTHKSSGQSRENIFYAGIKESLNRKEIFRKECRQEFYYRIWFAWASLGWILRQFLAGHFFKATGMLYGFIIKNYDRP
jgi:GT2 family glycosyltransferase